MFSFTVLSVPLIWTCQRVVGVMIWTMHWSNISKGLIKNNFIFLVLNNSHIIVIFNVTSHHGVKLSHPWNHPKTTPSCDIKCQLWGSHVSTCTGGGFHGIVTIRWFYAKWVRLPPLLALLLVARLDSSKLIIMDRSKGTQTTADGWDLLKYQFEE